MSYPPDRRSRTCTFPYLCAFCLFIMPLEGVKKKAPSVNAWFLGFLEKTHFCSFLPLLGSLTLNRASDSETIPREEGCDPGDPTWIRPFLLESSIRKICRYGKNFSYHGCLQIGRVLAQFVLFDQCCVVCPFCVHEAWLERIARIPFWGKTGIK